MLEKMNDESLMVAASRARGAAHRSEMSEIFEVNERGHPTGVKKIAENGHAIGWILRGNEFCALAQEIKRRGLAIPDCDCPPGSHD